MRISYERRRGSKRGKLFAATALVLILLFADIVTGGRVRALVRSGGSALSSVGSRAESAIFGGFFSSRASLISDNRSLTEQLSQYEERAAGYDALRAENDQLRALTHIAATTPGVTAPIVSSTRASPYGTFMIGAGSSEGIARGELVATDGGFVVGRVADIGSHTALVSELFAPNQSIEGISGLVSLQLEGYGGGNARAQAPRGVAIREGDPVFSPSVGQRPIGVVGNVASSSASASQEVYVRLPVNLATLQYVYVIK